MNPIAFLRRHLDSIILILAALVVFVWFQGPYLYYGLDTTFPVDPKSNLYNLLFAWRDNINTGVPNVSQAEIPFVLISYILIDVFKVPIPYSQQLIYYLCFVLGGLGAAKLLRFAFPALPRFSTVACSLLYMFNPFNIRYIWFSILPASALIFACFPWLVFFYLSISSSDVTSQKLGDWIGFIVSSIGCGSGNIPLILSPLVLLFECFIAELVINIRKSDLAFKRIAVLILPLVVFAFVNSYWLIPGYWTLTTQGVYGAGASERLSGLYLQGNSARSTFLNVVRLLGIFDPSDTTRQVSILYGTINVITVVLIIVPICSAFPLIFMRRLLRRSHKPFALVTVSNFIFMITLIMGLRGPLAPFLWAAVHNSYGAFIFSVPYLSFGLSLLLSYSVLFGLAIKVFLDSRVFKFLGTKRFIVGVTPLIALLITSYPMINGQTFNTNPPMPGRVSIPDYIYRTAAFLVDKVDDSRILSIPAGYNFVWDDWSHGYVGFNMLPLLGNLPTITGYFPVFYAPLNNLSLLAYSLPEFYTGSGYSNVLSMLGVKYIVLREDAGFIPGYIPYSNISRIAEFLNKTSGVDHIGSIGKRSLYFNMNDVNMVYAPRAVISQNRAIEKAGDITGRWASSLCSVGLDARVKQLSANYPVLLNGSYIIFYNCVPLHLSLNFTFISVNLQADYGTQVMVGISAQDNIGEPQTLIQLINEFTWLKPINNSVDLTSKGTISYGIITMNGLYYQVPRRINYIAILLGPQLNYNSSNPAWPRLSAKVYSVELSNWVFLSKSFDYRDSAIGPLNMVVNQPTIQYTRVNPSVYDVHVSDVHGTFVLVLSQTFNPRWYVVGKDITVLSHFPVNFYANGWVIRSNATNVELKVIYDGEHITTFSFILTIITVLAVPVCLICKDKLRKHRV